MKYDLANQCMEIYIWKNVASYVVSVVVIGIFLVLGVYYGIKEHFEQLEWERRRKEYWDHIKEVQDRFKDDDLR